jgi:hypothetical protein
MAYRSDKKGAKFFSTLIIILGAVIVKKSSAGEPALNHMTFQSPTYLGAGLILIGIFGIILLWAQSERKSRES